MSHLVHCVGGGIEVKDRLGSTTMSWREKSPPKMMSPLFSSTGKDIEPGIILHCWSWWELSGKITHHRRLKNKSSVLLRERLGSINRIQKRFIIFFKLDHHMPYSSCTSIHYTCLENQCKQWKTIQTKSFFSGQKTRAWHDPILKSTVSAVSIGKITCNSNL